MPITTDDLRKILDNLGESGLRAGLEASHLTVANLRQQAEAVGLKLPQKSDRKSIVAAIVAKLDQRIDKPIDELFKMTSDELLEYFENVRPNKSELLDILRGLDFHPGSDAQKNLYKYAARQIAETGMFSRVATKT